MDETSADRVRAWAFGAALPLWGDAGVDAAHGGFFEQIDAAGRPVDLGYKRTRAVARQVYVFSHAAHLGWRDGDEIAGRGLHFLARAARLGSTEGWARSVSTRGDVADATIDLYDIAFVLFALAWRYRQAGDARALAWMHETVDFIETQMRWDEGFAHELPRSAPRLQNLGLTGNQERKCKTCGCL